MTTYTISLAQIIAIIVLSIVVGATAAALFAEDIFGPSFAIDPPETMTLVDGGNTPDPAKSWAIFILPKDVDSASLVLNTVMDTVLFYASGSSKFVDENQGAPEISAAFIERFRGTELKTPDPIYGLGGSAVTVDIKALKDEGFEELHIVRDSEQSGKLRMIPFSTI